MLIHGTDALPVSMPAGRRWRQRPLLAVLAVMLLGLVPIASAAAWLQAPTDVSPASGGALVIAHGVIEIPALDLVWRIEREVATPPAAAEPAAATTGFLLGSEGVVLVEDAPEGEQTRLAPGEAVLARAGAAQVRAAIGPTGATYFAISLAAADAPVSPTGELLFASDPFAGLGGRHDVDLVRDVLAATDTTELPAGAGPTLVFVTAGAADVTLATGEIVTLAADQAIALSGPLVVTAGADGAVVQAAVIGPAVPRLTGPAAATTPPASPVAASPVAATTADPVATPAPAAEDAAADEMATDEAAEPAPDAAVEEAPAEDAAAVDPTVIDSDGDGLTDAEEANINADPASIDTDGDGLTDGDEVLVYGTAALAADTDGDGVLDGDEVAQGTDPLAAATDPGTAGDSDGDGLDDAFEAELGTDGVDTDTDDDGLTDGDEYFTYQTGTLNPDTDADGVLDGVEIENGTDPNDPNSF